MIGETIAILRRQLVRLMPILRAECRYIPRNHSLFTNSSPAPLKPAPGIPI
jgi:hypothetical protein